MVALGDEEDRTSGKVLNRYRAPLRRRKKAKRKGLPGLRSWRALPAYLRDNEFIRTGYRADLSFGQTLLSLFTVHNETGNVWSHLIGFLIFVRLTVYVASMPPSPQSFDGFWTSVHELQVQIEDEVHSLQHLLVHHVEMLKIALEHSLVSLHESLEETGVTVKTRFEEKWQAAQLSLTVRVGQIRTHLYESLKQLSDGITSIQVHAEQAANDTEVNSMTCTCNRNERLDNGSREAGQEENKYHFGDGDFSYGSNALVCAKEKLEISFAGLQDSLHNVQEAVSGNLHAVHGTLKAKLTSSFSSLQESLHLIQELIGFQKPANIFDSSSQCLIDPDPFFQEGLSRRPVVARWPVYVFMVGAMVSMLVSSACHLLGCCARHVSVVLWRFDYVGISGLIVSSFFPPVYYCFLCHPIWRRVYLTAISLLGAMTVIVCLMPFLQTGKYRSARAKLFSSLGLFGVVPLVHQCFINGDVEAVRQALVYMILMGATYLIGAALFATRAPERFWPGAFDLAFSSHQLFHIAVVFGAFFHYRATMVLLEWREGSGGSCPIT